MPPRQKAVRLTVEGNSAGSLAGQEQASQPDAGKRKRGGACMRCRSHKVKCEILPGANVCRRCEQSGLSNICELKESATRSTNTTSALPREAQVTQGKNRSRGASTSRSSAPPSTSQPKGSNQGKRKPESMGPAELRMKSVAPSSQKQTTIRSTIDNEDAQAAYLNPVAELDNSDHDPMTFDEDEEDTDLLAPPMEVLSDANQFMSVMTTGTSEPEYMDVNDGQSEISSENFDLEDVNSMSSDEDKSDAVSDDLLQQRRPSKHMAAVPPQACRKQKQQITKKVIASDDDTFEVFTIQCSAPRPDGIHAPFKILSTITLAALCDIVAEKMGRHPKTVRLQYRLDSDKAKQASTSIHSNDELDIFVARLQDLIVPGRLPSGRKSTRAPKNPVVQFEDMSFGNGGSSHPSKGGVKGSGTTSGAAKQKTTSESAPGIAGSSRRLELIKKLQERWICKIHSKGTDKWCYSPSGGNTCETITICNLSFWAMQIMEGRASIDEKPVSLVLENAPRTRSSSNQQSNVPMGQPGFPGPVGYGYPGYPPPIFVLPQWGVGPQGTGSLGLPPSSQGTGLPGQLSAQSGLSVPVPQNTTRSVSPALLKPVPELIEWFSYLDTHGGRNQDGIVYSQFGPVLKAKGFYRLNHISRKYIQLSDLQEWLGVEVGTAINIFEYAEEDLEAERAGTLVLPTFGFDK
ncbi:hypothetical protein JVT61DRAFT_13029 [Boletus reticuloceps]|uniref:Zn(2)-C6 fungal-type domain-containing protein n=1 Tax=Boletus reticuloceps TaxID=495285 RepID=A0A8I3ADV0_9AGAM|nr:hypothetical protein JVT61DRAFT_15406 [Boletus reticuloceps]KAG6378756.1 hypothetical protein JVT61DRAFT_13029 [Boletus reticuloceps]